MKNHLKIIKSWITFNWQLFIGFLAIFGFLLTLVLLISDVTNLKSTSFGINYEENWKENSMLLFFIFILSSTSAFSFATAPSILRNLSILKKEYKLPLFLGVVFFIFSLVIIELPVLIQVHVGGGINIADIALKEDILFKHPHLVFQGGLIFASISVVSCLFGIILVNYAIGKIFKEKTLPQKKNLTLLSKTLLLKKDLKYFISIIIVYLTILVLLLIINRQILITAIGKEKAFPIAFIFLLATLYSFFIACIYLPVYLNFKSKIRKIQSWQNENHKVGETINQSDDLSINQKNVSNIFQKQIIDKAKQLISEDRLDEAFDLVLKETQNPTVINELTILKQRWSDFKKRRIKGLVSEESSGITMASIVDRLLVVVDQ